MYANVFIALAKRKVNRFYLIVFILSIFQNRNTHQFINKNWFTQLKQNSNWSKF